MDCHSKKHQLTRLLYTPGEAGEMLGLSRSWVEELMSAGTIAYVRVGTDRRITAGALAAYVAQLGSQAPASDEGTGRTGP